MKHLFTKLLAAILTVSLLLSPIGALAEVDEVVVAAEVSEEVPAVEEELAPEVEGEPAQPAAAPVIEEPAPAEEEAAEPAAEEASEPAAEDASEPAAEEASEPAAEEAAEPAAEDASEPASKEDAQGEPADVIAPADVEGSDEAAADDAADAIVPEAVDVIVAEASSVDLDEIEDSGLSVEDEDGSGHFEMMFDGEQTMATLYANTYAWGKTAVSVKGSGEGATYQELDSAYSYEIQPGSWVLVTFTPVNGGFVGLGTVRVCDDSWNRVEGLTIKDDEGQTVDPEEAEGQRCTGAVTAEFQIGEGSYHAEASFYAPDNALECYYDNSQGTVTVTVGGEEATTANENDVVTVTAVPYEGYCLMSGGIYVRHDDDVYDHHYADFEPDKSNVYTATSDPAATFTFKKSDVAENIYVNFVKQATYTVTLQEDDGVRSWTYSTANAKDADHFTLKNGRYAFIFPDINELYNNDNDNVKRGEEVDFNSSYVGLFNSGEVWELYNEEYTFTVRRYIPEYNLSWSSTQNGSITGQAPEIGIYVGDEKVGGHGMNGPTNIAVYEEVTLKFTMGEKVKITDLKVYNVQNVQGPYTNGIQVNVEETDGVYTFAMPAGMTVICYTFGPKGAYTITCVPGDHGTIAMMRNGMPADSADAGDYLWWSATPDPDYALDKVTVAYGTTTQTYVTGQGPMSINMPASNITVTPTFRFIGGQYRINIEESENGSVNVMKQGSPVTTANAGDYLSLGFMPEYGYRPDTVTVNYNGENIVQGYNNWYSFEMPAGDVTVSATFVKGKHAITVNPPANGGYINVMINGFSVSNANEGDRVDLNASIMMGDPSQNRPWPYTVKQGEDDIDVLYDSRGAYFYMPDAPVTVSAEFVSTTAGNLITYNNTAPLFPGARVSGYSYEYGIAPHALAGETVEICYSDESGEGEYRIGTFSVTCNGTPVEYRKGYNEATYQSFFFTMPDGPVNVTATVISVDDIPEATLTTEPKAVKDLVYSGEELALVTAGEAENGTVMYALSKDGDLCENEDWNEEINWSKAIPTATDAGTYYVYYMVDADEDYLPIACDEPIEVEIARKPATVKYESLTKTYGDDDSDPDIVGTTDFLDGYTVKGTPGRVEGKNVKRYAYTIGDLAEQNPNYDITVQGTLTIVPREVTLDWSNGDETFTYNGEAQLPTATVTNLVDGDECEVTVIPAEDYNATDAGNHTAVAATLSNANYMLPEEENCKKNYTIVKANHPDVEEVLTITVSSQGAEGTVDLSQIIPDEDGVNWSVTLPEGETFITSAEKGGKRTLSYKTSEAAAGTTGTVTISIDTKNYTTFTATVTFVASEGDLFTLTLMSNGEVFDTRELHTGDAYGELPEDLSRQYYTFKGWVDSDKRAVNDENANNVMGSSDATIYADWTPNKYHVALVLNEHGTIPAGEAANYPYNIRTFTIEDPAFALPKLADVDESGKTYTFSGWTLAGAAEGALAYTDVTIDPATVLATLTGDEDTITYTANWVEGEMVGTVTYTAPTDNQSGILGLKGISTDGNNQATALGEELKLVAAEVAIENEEAIPQDSTSKKVVVGMEVTEPADENEKAVFIQQAKIEQPTVEGVDVKTDFINIDIKQTTSYFDTNNVEQKMEDVPLTELNRVLEIPVNYNMTGRYNLRLFRKHDGTVQEFKMRRERPAIDERKDGEFYIHGLGQEAVIYTYSSLFSAFAISSDNRESFEVTFDSNGGSAVKPNPQKVYKGEKVVKPANPTKAATATTVYTFDTWCTDKALKTAYDFSKPVTEGFTLYARWTERAIEKANNPAPAAVQSESAPAGPAITIPKAPAKVKAKAAKKGKVTVSWKKIKNNKKNKALLKQIKGIEVQISTDPTFTTDVQTKNLGKKKTKFVFKKLQKNTVYYARVRYTDGAGGVSKWSATKKVKTKKK